MYQATQSNRKGSTTNHGRWTVSMKTRRPMSPAMIAAMMQIGDALCAIRFKSSQIGSNEDNENYDTSKYRECWVSHACELLWECTDRKANVSTKDSNTNKNGECWVTRYGELYAIYIGALARSSDYELKTQEASV